MAYIINAILVIQIIALDLSPGITLKAIPIPKIIIRPIIKNTATEAHIMQSLYQT